MTEQGRDLGKQEASAEAERARRELEQLKTKQEKRERKRTRHAKRRSAAARDVLAHSASPKAFFQCTADHLATPSDKFFRGFALGPKERAVVGAINSVLKVKRPDGERMYRGVHVSVAELGQRIGCSESSTRRAINKLKHLEFINVVEQHRDMDWEDGARRYQRRQLRNVLTLGHRGRDRMKEARLAEIARARCAQRAGTEAAIKGCQTDSPTALDPLLRKGRPADSAAGSEGQHGAAPRPSTPSAPTGPTPTCAQQQSLPLDDKPVSRAELATWAHQQVMQFGYGPGAAGGLGAVEASRVPDGGGQP